MALVRGTKPIHPTPRASAPGETPPPIATHWESRRKTESKNPNKKAVQSMAPRCATLCRRENLGDKKGQTAISGIFHAKLFGIIALFIGDSAGHRRKKHEHWK